MIGQVVQIWYRKELASSMPYHSMIGAVEIASKRRRKSGPINHAVRLDSQTVVVVPCGNLRPPKLESHQ